jgi:molecular chaperone DnaK
VDGLEPILVIDFGTTYSCAALVDGSQPELIHEPSSGLLAWPSSVLVDDSEILVGSLAESRKIVQATQYRSEIKRYLSRGESVNIGGRDYPPEDLVAAVLSAFRAEAERVKRGPVTRAVLTKPAAYRPGDRRNEQMIAAGEAAGFQVVELLPEPTAAAFSVTSRENFAPGSLVLVYDWGGGTFDAALVRVEAEGGEIIESGALPYCGGVDIDEAVARFLCSRAQALGDLYGGGDKGRTAVLDLAERLKRELSGRPDGLQDVMGIEASLTVDEFEKLAEPLVARTIECCRELLEAAGTAAEDLGGIFMAGGGARIPLVGQTLQAEFGLVPVTARDPELAVIRGAAQWAGRSESRSSDGVAPGTNATPLRWDIPGDLGTLIDWRVATGDAFPGGATLARLRLPDGTLLSLNAAKASVLRGQHARPGDEVTSDRWLATIDVASGWLAKEDFPAVMEYRNDRSNPATECAVLLAAYPGSLYVLCGKCCYVLDPSSGKSRRLFSTEDFPVQGLRTLGNFRGIRPGGDSLVISAGRTHDKSSADRWFEVNRHTGRFIREL